MKSVNDTLISLIREESRRINSTGRGEEGLLFIHYNEKDIATSACFNSRALSQAIVALMKDEEDFASAVIASAFIFLDSIGTSADDCADLMKEIKLLHPPSTPEKDTLS